MVLADQIAQYSLLVPYCACADPPVLEAIERVRSEMVLTPFYVGPAS